MISPVDLFGRTRIAAKRINRQHDLDLGRFVLDATTAQELGHDGVGVLVANCEEPATIIRCLRNLDKNDSTLRWVLMSDSKVNAGYIRDHWNDPDTPDSLRSVSWLELGERGAWSSNSVLHGTVESVSRHIEALQETPSIAGVFLFDPHAYVHKAREIRNGAHRFAHDRPQIVVNLRTCLTVKGWTPPLFILTNKGPREVDVEAVSRAYCLEALRYLDGRTLLISS